MHVKKVTFTPSQFPWIIQSFKTQYEEQLEETMHKLCCNQITTKTWAAEQEEDGQRNAMQQSALLTNQNLRH